MSPLITHVLMDLAWSAGGGVVGYALGRKTRSSLGGEHSSHDSRGHWAWRGWLGNLLGVLLLLLIGVTMWNGYQRLECQAEAGRAYSVGTLELRDAAAIEREANRIRWAFIKEALAAEPPPVVTDEYKRVAQLRWLADLRRADALIDAAEAKRAANPPPALPDCS